MIWTRKKRGNKVKIIHHCDRRDEKPPVSLPLIYLTLRHVFFIIIIFFYHASKEGIEILNWRVPGYYYNITTHRTRFASQLSCLQAIHRIYYIVNIICSMHCKFLSSRGVWEKFFSRKKRVDCDVRKNRWQSLSNDLPRCCSRRRRSYSFFVLALNPCALLERNRGRK